VSFYGIVLRKEDKPLGRFRLNGTFDQPDNFRKEPLTFEVINFPDVYQALLGQSCFAKFKAIPNYTYLKLKMPGPKGVITIEGNFEQAYYCEQDYIAQATTLITPYAPNGPSHDARRTLVEEATKTMVVLDRPSIGKAVKPTGDSGGLLAPPSRRSAP
jgi:hypothetical protein